MRSTAKCASKRSRKRRSCSTPNASDRECPDATLREIAALAREAGAFVMVDEVYREMRFEAEPQTAFLLDPERFRSGMPRRHAAGNRRPGTRGGRVCDGG